MTLGAKIFMGAAVLCIFLWAVVLVMGVQPLITSQNMQVIYGEGEDFYSDAAVLNRLRSESFYVLHLPKARTEYRWWIVDFKNQIISISGQPRYFRKIRYRLKTDSIGPRLGSEPAMAEWYWHFTPDGAAFSGNGFTCSIRKIENKKPMQLLRRSNK